MNEREKLEKRINYQAETAETQLQQQREAGQKLMENEARYKAEKAKATHDRQLAEEKKKQELFGRR